MAESGIRPQAAVSFSARRTPPRLRARSAPVPGGKALQLTNTSTTAGSTALGLSVASGKAPFTVNSSGKVTNLNADKLDGLDSTSFLRSNGKAADSDKLDGLDSSAFLPAAAKATDSELLDGLDSGAFLRDDFYEAAVDATTGSERVGDGDGVCEGNERCYAEVACDPADRVISGGFDGVDPGTSLTWNRMYVGYKWRLEWTNNSTVDFIDLRALCLR